MYGRDGGARILALFFVPVDREAFDLIKPHVAKEFEQWTLGLALTVGGVALIAQMAGFDLHVLAARFGKPREILRRRHGQGHRQFAALWQVKAIGPRIALGALDELFALGQGHPVAGKADRLVDAAAVDHYIDRIADVAIGHALRSDAVLTQALAGFEPLDHGAVETGGTPGHGRASGADGSSITS